MLARIIVCQTLRFTKKSYLLPHNYPIMNVLCSFEAKKDKNPTVKWQEEEEKGEGKEKKVKRKW